MIMHSYFIITFVSLYFLFSLTHSQLSLVHTFFTIDIFVVLKAFWLLISYTINDRIAEILILLYRCLFLFSVDARMRKQHGTVVKIEAR